MLVIMDGEEFEVDTFENPIRYNRTCAIVDDFAFNDKTYMMVAEVNMETRELGDEIFCYVYTIENGNISIMDIVDEKEEMDVRDFYMDMLRGADL